MWWFGWSYWRRTRGSRALQVRSLSSQHGKYCVTLLHRFRPEALLCPTGVTNSTTCLTRDQAAAVRLAFTDYYGVDGKMIYPRMQPGSESVASMLYYSGNSELLFAQGILRQDEILTILAFPYSDDWFKYVVYNDSNWDSTKFSIQDAAVALAQNPFNIASWDADISAFKNAGGKLRKRDKLVILLNGTDTVNSHVSRPDGWCD